MRCLFTANGSKFDIKERKSSLLLTFPLLARLHEKPFENQLSNEEIRVESCYFVVSANIYTRMDGWKRERERRKIRTWGEKMILRRVEI